MLIFIGFASLSGGCAAHRSTVLDRDLVLELEEQNARLEAEVTRLREEKLKTARKSDCSAQSGNDKASATREERADELPVVEMNPPEPSEELEAGVAIVRPAEPLQDEEPVNEDTRPVLKVRGQHEAWVYHRPLTAEDRNAKTDAIPKE